MKTSIKSKNLAEQNLNYLRLIQPEKDKSKFFYLLLIKVGMIQNTEQ